MAGLLGFLLARCHGGDNVVGLRRIASVAVLLGSDFVLLGDTTSATVEVRDANDNVVEASQITWKTGDPAVAEVSIQGIVSGMGYGTTEIVASVTGVSGSAQVVVVDSATSLASSAAEPELPKTSVDVSWRQPSGRTLHVRSGDNLQKALNAAARGDEVVLDAAATFTGNFVLPAKAGSAADGWITVRTSALNSLPPLGTRIDPAVHAQYMPKIVTNNTMDAIRTAMNARGWRLVGLEITVAPGVAVYPVVNNGIVLLGDGDGRVQRDSTTVARDLILDRVWVHGQPTTNVTRCVAMNSGSAAIVNSWITDCHAKGFDAQAAGGWNGMGPYLIENNRLEASGEVLMWGGGDPGIAGLIPSDITVRRNYLTRPMSWRGVWTVKNLFELKNAQRVLVEDNVMQNNWVDGQIGFAVLLGSVNQDGHCTWCVVQDVTLRYNHIHNSAGGFNIFEWCGRAAPGGSYGCTQGGQATRRIALRHNLLTDIGGDLGSNGRMFQFLDRIDDLTVEHNTGFAPQIYITFGEAARRKARFVFRNNVGGGAEYPVHGAQAMGARALVMYTGVNSRFERNIIVTRQPAQSLPPNNTYVRDMGQLGFDETLPGIAAWRLPRQSPYVASGSGAATPGADIDQLIRRLTGVTSDGQASAQRSR